MRLAVLCIASAFFCVPARAPLDGGDTVHTKDGKKTSGRVIPYLSFVEVEGKDGKRVKIDRKDIDHIDLESRIIHYPQLKPFPNEKIKDGEFEFVSAGTVVVAIPRDPGTVGYGVDLVSGKTLFELDFKNRVGTPVIVNGLAYFMRLDLSQSDTIKYKVGGVLSAKDVQKLTVTCVDLKTGKPVWTQPYDNLDTAKELHWLFIPESITLYVLPKSVMVFTTKRGSPIDKQSVLDKATTKTYATFYTFNVEKLKAEKQTHSDEAANQAGAYVTDDLFIYLWYDGRDEYRIRAFDFKNGRQRWESEPFRGRLATVAGKRAFCRDDFNLWAIDASTGKRSEAWALEHNNEISSIDEEFVIQFRKSKLPKQIIAFDLTQKKLVEHVKIDMGTDEFSWRAKIGPLLFFTNKANDLICYDLYQKLELWRYVGPGNGEPRHIYLQGTGITFYKDGLVTHVDLATGKVVWCSYGDYMRIVQGGDVGAICLKRAGSDVIKERPLPKEALFATATGTPLRNIYIDDQYSPPALIDGKIVTFTNKSRLVARDVKTGAEVWNVRVAAETNSTPPAIVALGGRIILVANGKASFIDPKDGSKVASLGHYAPELATPFLSSGGNVLLADPAGGAKLVEPATAKVLWEAKEFNSVQSWTTNGKLLWILESGQVREYDLATGKFGRGVPLPQATNLWQLDGETLHLANHGFRVGRINRETGDYAWKVDSKNQDSAITMKFGGRLAMVEGVLCWGDSDGMIQGFEPVEGKPLWKVETKPWMSAWLVHGGRIYVAAPGVGLLAIDAKTGQLTSKIEVEDAHLFTPLMLGDKPCFWSYDGWWVQCP